MSDIKQMDAFIKDILPIKYTATTLFILFDSNKGLMRHVFQNPFEIIRDFWKEHSMYADIDTSYYDTLSFLYHKSNELMYFTASRKLQQLLENPEKCTAYDINDVSFLFLSQHSSMCPNLLFGYVHLPDQYKLLLDIFKAIDLYKPEQLISYMLSTAESYKSNTLKIAEKMKTS